MPTSQVLVERFHAFSKPPSGSGAQAQRGREGLRDQDFPLPTFENGRKLRDYQEVRGGGVCGGGRVLAASV